MSLLEDDVKKIAEKTEEAKREFFKKVEKIRQNHGTNAKMMKPTCNAAAQEYNKVFGRIGVHPMLHLKNGKKRPRYLVDRDEMWVMYKPPLWQMGGSEDVWQSNVRSLASNSASLESAQNRILETEKAENIQEWHGLTQGLKWVDHDQPFTGWGFIQRLDLETDGPVIAAKTYRAQRYLQAQMREHLFSKAYICLVHGKCENRIKYVNAPFAELGSDESTQIMLKHDPDNDPFHDWTKSGVWPSRVVRRAETFYKPLAYYTRKEDGSEYSLVYVNILTGITHQIRITMQSEGFPLVSDDRYLPRDQAMADLKWCPRNFLTEVRADFFDMSSPFKDEKRRRCTRLSLENPLPKIFQNVLEVKLTLQEKLDATADLYVGCRYWALGDEQLMAAFPKEDEYRQKVIRWGTRKGIHLDALDRLLLLPREEVDDVLSSYKNPNDKDEESWVCPKCMAYNHPATSKTGNTCHGQNHKTREPCGGEKVVENEETYTPPTGWFNWAADPTVHFLLQVNAKWIENRKKILKFPRPKWEEPPTEALGSPFTDEIMIVLEAALNLDARSGGYGIMEGDLKDYPGLEDIKLPLGDPGEESNLSRCRLPGKGSQSQWIYTLKGRERLKATQNFSAKCKTMSKPIVTKSEALPAKSTLTSAEKKKRKMDVEKAKKLEKDEEGKGNGKLDLRSDSEGEKNGKANSDDERTRTKRKTKWKKMESSSNPGSFYYFDSATGLSQTDRPADFEEAAPAWERIESKSNRGEFYYYNKSTMENRVERPVGVEIKNDVPKGAARRPAAAPKEDGIAWRRVESSSKPGSFYYFNPLTGGNELNPPEVSHPWKLIESKSKKGQYYYHNEDSAVDSVDPPSCARPSKGPPPKKPRIGPAPGGDEVLPPGWKKKESDTNKGKFYYVHLTTGKTIWTRPSPWEKKESSSNPGKFYYQNGITGETSWTPKE